MAGLAFHIARMAMVKVADWIIDLGPLGGYRGGQLIAEGTPEQVAEDPNSFTGQYLKKVLEEAHRKGQIE